MLGSKRTLRNLISSILRDIDSREGDIASLSVERSLHMLQRPFDTMMEDFTGYEDFRLVEMS